MTLDFVVGHPRSGTAYFTHLLNSTGRRIAEHEWLVKISDGELKSRASEFYERRASARRVRRILSRYAAHPEVVIDCNWKLSWILPVVLEQFPNARIVHLTRDPRSNVRATYNLDYYGDTLRTLTRREYVALRAQLEVPPAADIGLEYASVMGWYRSFPRLALADWQHLARFEKNCAFYRETHRLIAEAAPARYLRVRLEDLNDVTTAQRALAFLGVEPSEQRLKAALAAHVNDKAFEKRLVGELGVDRLPPFAEWPELFRNRLSHWCGAIARELGYTGVSDG